MQSSSGAVRRQRGLTSTDACPCPRSFILSAILVMLVFIIVQLWMVAIPLHWSTSHGANIHEANFRLGYGSDHERLERVEAALLALQSSGEERQSMLKRISDLEKVAKAYLASTPIPCPSGLGDFSSTEAMTKAGWKWSLNQVKLTQGMLLGWTDDSGIGSMSLEIKVAGKLQLHLGNAHRADNVDNRVYITVNEEVVASLGKEEYQHLCILVEAGDVLHLAEVYGQISLASVEMSCVEPQSKSNSQASQSNRASGITCPLQQSVQLQSRSCGSGKLGAWQLGRVERVLNETMAIVRLDERPSMRKGSAIDASTVPTFSQYRIATAAEMYLPSQNRTHCANFSFGRHRIGIIMVADDRYRQTYAAHIQTQRCYAAWRGYDYVMLQGADFPNCNRFQQEFFFQKHCLVSEYLGGQPSDYVAVVVDADVVAVVLDRGMEGWVNVGADIHFYERAWCPEIAAGNYIVRATPWARNFLMRWAEFMYLKPDSFASSDNGAIHLHIIQTLELDGAKSCRDMYSGIQDKPVAVKVAGGEGVEANQLKSYFDFVNCVKKVLGPPRLWRTSGGGSLAFWGKFHFFAADGVYLGWKASNYFGPVFLHGVKDVTMVKENFYSDLGSCKLNKTAVHLGRESFIDHVTKQAKFLTGHLAQWPYNVSFPGPRECKSKDLFDSCLLPCVSTLSCPLLGNTDEPRPQRSCTECQGVQHPAPSWIGTLLGE